MPADGTAPPTTRRRRDTNAKLRIGWAVREEIKASPGLTHVGFELPSRAEQLKRIRKWLQREGVPASEMPTVRQLRSFLEKHSQLELATVGR
jgi:hypothetical protein